MEAVLLDQSPAETFVSAGGILDSLVPQYYVRVDLGRAMRGDVRR